MASLIGWRRNAGVSAHHLWFDRFPFCRHLYSGRGYTDRMTLEDFHLHYRVHIVIEIVRGSDGSAVRCVVIAEATHY